MASAEALKMKVAQALNKALATMLLAKYFEYKGLGDKMDTPVFPPAVMDIGMRIPELANMIEVVPYIESIDPNSGAVVVGWNLFILGFTRMHLGESSHENAVDLLNSVNGAPKEVGNTEKNYTPNQIIEFVVDTISKSQSGRVDTNLGAIMGGDSSQNMIDPFGRSGMTPSHMYQKNSMIS